MLKASNPDVEKQHNNLLLNKHKGLIRPLRIHNGFYNSSNESIGRRKKKEQKTNGCLHFVLFMLSLIEISWLVILVQDFSLTA